MRKRTDNHNLRLAGPLSKKIKFTSAEDEKLKSLVEKYSTKDWKKIASYLPPRTARQCRERWTNYINPELSQNPWTKEEDKALIIIHQQIGNHWKKIGKYLPQRSKNSIKIRWNFLNNLINDQNIVDLIDNQQPSDCSSFDPIYDEQPIIISGSTVNNNQLNNIPTVISDILPEIPPPPIPTCVQLNTIYYTVDQLAYNVHDDYPTYIIGPQFYQEIIDHPPPASFMVVHDQNYLNPITNENYF